MGPPAEDGGAASQSAFVSGAGVAPPAPTEATAPQPGTDPGVDLDEATAQSPARPEAAESAPPTAGAGPAPADPNEGLASLAASLESKNHYEVLGVAVDATAEQIRAAYFKLARQYHPDSYAGADSGTLAAANKVFSAVTEANRVLSESTKREKYTNEAVHGHKSEEETAEEQALAALQADTYYKQGLSNLQAGRLAESLKLFRKAYQTFGQDPVYRAAYGYLVQIASRGDEIAQAEAERLATSAKEENEENIDVAAYHGGWLAETGQIKKGVTALRKVLGVNPDHREALAIMSRISRQSQRAQHSTETETRRRRLFGR
jgi:curved DNA-binding protein CbpA